MKAMHYLRNRGTDPWDISRRILGPKNRTSTDTSNSPASDEESASQRSLPLPTDVVGLVGQGNRDIGVCTGCNEEHAKVAGAAR